MSGRRILWKNEIEELETARKNNKNKNVEKRLLALLMHGKGEEHKKIAARTGYAASYISALVTKYINIGIDSIVGNNYRGNRRNMSAEEERALLDKFKEQAEKGQIVEIAAIKKAYEKATGRSLEKSHGQIYKVLKRHGWRKVMPRSKHPGKARDEVIETSKKLTIRSRMRWKKIGDKGKVRLMFQDEAGFGRINKPKYCWCFPNFRPAVPCRHVREYRYAYGAAEPLAGETFFLILPYSNTDCMNIFLS